MWEWIVSKQISEKRVPTQCKMVRTASDPEKMHNYYTYLYNQCVFELLKKEKGESEAVLFARSAAPGGQKFPVPLGRRFNQPVYFHGRNLKGRAFPYGRGFGFWSHDIGGFEDDGSAGSVQKVGGFRTFNLPTVVYTDPGSYRVPWNYDEEACEVLKYFIPS